MGEGNGKLKLLTVLLPPPQVVEPVLTIAAALSVQSPFSRLADDDEQSRWEGEEI